MMRKASMTGAKCDVVSAVLDPPGRRIDAQAILGKASRATGLSCLGSNGCEIERFRIHLDILCHALNEEAALSSLGVRRAQSRLTLMTICRLLSVERRERDGNFRSRVVMAPLIGTGLPRSGTTFLHGLLACDPQNRAVHAWEAMLSPDLVGKVVDRPELLFQSILRFQGFLGDELRDIHPFDAELQEECVFLQEANCGAVYAEFFDVPSFSAIVAQKHREDLRWQIGQMKLLQRSAPDKRWVLKAPTHVFTWEETLLAFPDAHIYMNHRDPAEAIPSVTALTVAIRRLFSRRQPDAVTIARERLEVWSRAMRQVIDWRKDHPDHPIFDVRFAALVNRPLETVAELYARHKLPLAQEARDAMKRYLDRNEHPQRRGPRLSLQDCGLDRSTVDAAFGDYLRRFDLVASGD